MATLHNFGISPSDFHAKVILRKTNAQSNAAVESLAKLVRKHRRRIHPVSAAIVVDDFKSLSLGQRKFITGATYLRGELVGSGSPSEPYYVPLQYCVRRIASYAPSNGKAHFYVGIDRSLYDYASALYKKLALDPKADRRLGNFSAPRAAETPELQAADLLAYILYRNYPEIIKAFSEGRQIASLPDGRDGIFAYLLSGTKSSQDHTFQDRKCIMETLAKAPNNIKVALHA